MSCKIARHFGHNSGFNFYQWYAVIKYDLISLNFKVCFLTFQPFCSAFLLFTCTKLNKLMLIIIWQTQISWTCFLKKLSQNKLSFQCSMWLASVLLSLLSLLLIGLFFDLEFITLFVFLIHKLQAYYHAVNI